LFLVFILGLLVVAFRKSASKVVIFLQMTKKIFFLLK